MKRTWLFLGWMVVGPFCTLAMPSSWRLQAVDLFLPLIGGGMAWLLRLCPAKCAAAPRWNPWHGLFAGACCLVISVIAIPMGYQLGWLYFSYGARPFSSEVFRTVLLWEIPVIILVAWLGYEWLLRRVLWSRLLERAGPWPTWLITSCAGALLQWPRLLLAHGATECPYLISAGVELLMLEMLCGLLVALSGRLAPAVLLHALARVIDVCLVGDVLSPYLPLIHFASSNAVFYTMKAMLPALLVAALACRLASPGTWDKMTACLSCRKAVSARA